MCQRTEKGTAVMASEYLNRHYPEIKGFSPTSLRRMRDFYRTYEHHPLLLSCAMELGWIQNMVIMEAELTMELREWYMKAVIQLDWSKTELITNIAENAHESIEITVENSANYHERNISKYIDLALAPIKINLSYTYFMRMLNSNLSKRRCYYEKIIYYWEAATRCVVIYLFLKYNIIKRQLGGYT